MPRSRADRAVEPASNPAGAVQGTVLAGALIAAQSAHEPVDASRLVVLVLLTQLVHWPARVYAETAGHRVDTGRRPGWPEVQRLVTEERSLVGASSGPPALVVLAGVAGAPVPPSGHLPRSASSTGDPGGLGR
ncbi:hypothetical protein QOZ88_04680 [Blastococcus sp. BMG 814]|uniref:Uncharacterized protein n=1 Tax=Blastococcus carthaginiensis TaxID=3050034 RepID=A0ABT9I8N9_9ACTN|nr:hypothetical protein [Blastococcus carthaginiensis]MDP5181923.1 hypothetical protein [Blastococcus carthaginiensis]